MSKHPETSLEAYHALTPEKLAGDYAKIINALKVLGTATYEQISDFNGCREPNIISRRLKELESKELIFKTGEKRLTKRNRNAFVYCLTNQPKTDNQAREASRKPNEPSVANNSVNVLRQANLFQ